MILCLLSLLWLTNQREYRIARPDCTEGYASIILKKDLKKRVHHIPKMLNFACRKLL